MERFIKNLARGAGAILRDGFRTEFKISQKKASYDLVTEYDLASEQFIVDRLRKKYPQHGIIAEETGHRFKGRDFWLIDPMDGTIPFCRGLAGFCVSIAFAKAGKIKLGAVYDPVADEMFFAEWGRGATLNGRGISVSKQAELQYREVSLLLGSAETPPVVRRKIFDVVAQYSMWPLGVGSAALCCRNVACGRYDIVISKSLFPWDYAAASVILKEAGANVSDFKGRPFRWNFDELVAANPVLHTKIMKEFHSKKL